MSSKIYLRGGVVRSSRYLALRDELALLLGYECGTRTSELTNSLNFQVKKLKHLISKTESEGKTSFDIEIYGKGNDKERTILITSKVFTKLKIFLNDNKLRNKFSDDLPLFTDEYGKPILSTDYGSDVFTRLKNGSSDFVHDLKNKTYQSLRHSFATNLATWCFENNKSWQSVLPPRMGHVDWSVSLIYVELEALMNNRIELLNKLKSKGELKRYRRG